jgi:hypothetical protein
MNITREGRARALADPVLGASAAEVSAPVVSARVVSARVVSARVVSGLVDSGPVDSGPADPRVSVRRGVAVAAGEADGGDAGMCGPPSWPCSPRNPGTVTRS